MGVVWAMGVVCSILDMVWSGCGTVEYTGVLILNLLLLQVSPINAQVESSGGKVNFSLVVGFHSLRFNPKVSKYIYAINSMKRSIFFFEVSLILNLLLMVDNIEIKHHY